ncbi:hypothetical protein BCR34DRAFT_284099 [Clohesyomyces aquaticus]|uniref:Uncharacterized protein n=1 Tax=Clohesyomyces aquaticus TaxID=1231657 RepID=A0A1Y1ZRA6_9PLEO|nr:hypothetical protein BCR34DRAFT_284099 [Clohesyomyces aquaticus]
MTAGATGRAVSRRTSITLHIFTLLYHTVIYSFSSIGFSCGISSYSTQHHYLIAILICYLILVISGRSSLGRNWNLGGCVIETFPTLPSSSQPPPFYSTMTVYLTETLFLFSDWMDGHGLGSIHDGSRGLSLLSGFCLCSGVVTWVGRIERALWICSDAILGWFRNGFPVPTTIVGGRLFGWAGSRDCIGF